MVERLKRLVDVADRWFARRRSTRVMRRAIVGFAEDQGLEVAGSMAYFAVLSLFQLVVLGVIVFSLFIGEGEARRIVVERLEAALPLEVGAVGDIVDGIIASRGGITVVSIAILVWGSLGFFGALSTGVGRAFAVGVRRPFWEDKLIGLVLLATTGSLVIVGVGIGIVTGLAAELASRVPGGEAGSQLVLALIGLIVPILLTLLALLIVYRVVPNRRVTWRQAWQGALVGTAGFTILRVGFTWFATQVARYESFFGPISTVISLLVFLHFAGAAVLLGAEFARANVLEDEEG
ncbi:MAG: YihY/virulence factor BrkB family protein [Chloroflexota bacterium]|nr:YihY/virulence factor BrkB family protein [Chloroflexota bacterium]